MGLQLVDTNVLVYAYDRSEPEKSLSAEKVFDNLARQGSLVLSTQVLAEFFVIVTRRIVAPIPVEQAVRSVGRYLSGFPVLPVTGPIVREALRGVTQHGLSYWDAQLWATARLNQIEIIVTEDVPGHQEIEGVRYLDPFRDFHDPA